ncbi:GAK system CofD-like protein [Pseudoruegeria sp. SK021]|uniref:GAK system CofD-like protein n=1 Tax=Pseudoruegeria sp. SK021 TaxID=1933035 RepID=UPI000A24E976|nr:GAK system CofD-like protein [Pseudoruegeria sp. SK021]OSP54365.1 hypothetical protein BV911_12855 [Pseudoruegeria sp. SK021]
MPNALVSRRAEFPDALRIARAKSSPGLGPRMVFFSGGSALNDTSRSLKNYTHNSVHLITPFDNGGSSRRLRDAFNMPAVGDLRSRLMALADETELGQPEIYALFTHRLPERATEQELNREFDALRSGQHRLMKAVPQPMRGLILAQLRVFDDHKPKGFDFCRASVGNLILAGGYFANDRALEPVLFLMSKMVDVLGTVRAVADVNFHIGADLADGSRVLGQRQLTGKEEAPLRHPIKRLFLTDMKQEVPPSAVRLPKRNRKLIERADLICYSPGSLYSSVIAALLPELVGTTIAAQDVPKVYVPSLGTDPECLGLSLLDQVDALLSALRRDAGSEVPAVRLISHILCDANSVDADMARQIGRVHHIQVLRLTLRKKERPDFYDPVLLSDALISMT